MQRAWLTLHTLRSPIVATEDLFYRAVKNLRHQLRMKKQKSAMLRCIYFDISHWKAVEHEKFVDRDYSFYCPNKNCHFEHKEK